MNKRPKKEMEYPDAPSGFVTLYNYKEPFMEYRGGSGYMGVLLFDGETDKIQCHLCGDWFEHLVPHIAAQHKMNAARYKREVGLSENTALISETVRAKLIAHGLSKRMQNLRVHRKHSEESRRKIAAGLKRHSKSMEGKNIRNTCPIQLLERLRALHDKLGRTPREVEIGFYDTLKKVYGTMKKACMLAGIEYRKPGQTVKKGRMLTLDRQDLIKQMRQFRSVNKRKPSPSDTKRGLLPSCDTYIRKFGSFKKALSVAFN